MTLFMGAFFSESAMCFSNLQSSKKVIPNNYPEKLNLNFLPITVNNKFKFQAQDSNLEYIFFFLRFGDLKNQSHFLNKSYL